MYYYYYYYYYYCYYHYYYDYYYCFRGRRLVSGRRLEHQVLNAIGLLVGTSGKLLGAAPHV